MQLRCPLRRRVSDVLHNVDTVAVEKAVAVYYAAIAEEQHALLLTANVGLPVESLYLP